LLVDVGADAQDGIGCVAILGIGFEAAFSQDASDFACAGGVISQDKIIGPF
jgi:hypothetical protein